MKTLLCRHGRHTEIGYDPGIQNPSIGDEFRRASGLAIVLTVLSFEDKREKVYKELLEIYGTVTPKSARIKYEDLQHMNYLDRFIKETMRLFPAAPLIGRHLTEDVKMGEFILPKGVEIVVPILSVHRNEKYWHNPLIFDPDRFLPEKIGTAYNNYYMPFFLGPRNCIGMKYAMILIKVVLATLIRTFIFKVDKRIQIDEIKLNMDVTLSSVEPIEVKIEKRELR
ncbi:cytochrome P450 4g15-like [Camponotus floridanus]|uniref:cytochrome P450 4g15-like n=1 Tax=Camponotus floridanus TaxID=104421 RepID=UPI000DC6CF0D|nr:cytochrome P450 4g15-like [Camponotus floridanus]